MPFGVDVDVIRPPGGIPDLDVVSVGNDPRRDWELLARVADRLHPRTVTAVVAPDALPGLRAGSRIGVRAGVPLPETLALLGRARVVALPVGDNLYSGATTVLLQAMALGRPVVVSRTRAVADGYGLVDGKTCLLVPPGDPYAFEAAVRGLLDDPEAAEQLGARGRAHVVEHLSWTRYERTLADAVTAVAERRLS